MPVRRVPYGAMLFFLNAYVVWRAFFLEWSRHMGSIEGAYIGISRHILASFPDVSWWPAWYGGIPFANSYPPLLHYAVALWAWVAGHSAARAHHAVTAILYCLGPVFAYLMLKRLSGHRFRSFCAALLYTVISPAALLVLRVGSDMGNPWRPRRLHTLIAYGDGPHLAALALVPLAIYALDCALERRTPLRCLGAAAAMAAVACTNWLGGFALAALTLCYLASRTPVRWRDWVAAGAIGAAAYAAVSPLMPPSLIATIQFNAQTIGGDFRTSSATLRHNLPYAGAVFVAAALLMRWRRVPSHLQMLMLFTGLMAWISLGFSWFGVAVVPQPDRYLLELDLGLTLLAAMAVAQVPKVARVAAVALGVFAVPQLYWGQRYARSLIRPVKIETTVEYRVAHWCGEHLGGARVMVPGSISFFYNAFTEGPQLAGGFENGVIDYVDRVAQFQILHGMGTTALSDAPMSILWLKAFGVQAVAAGGARTREAYRAFENGAKFQDVLPELFRDGDDAIYRVPLRSASLAHVMARGQLCSRPPVNGIDVAEMRRYVEAIDDPALPEAQFVWRTNHAAEVLAELAPGQVVSLQITYHPGWRAMVNGRAAPVTQDGLGFLAVAPDCTGRCRMELVYDGGREQQVARGASSAVFLCWLGWAAANTLRQRVRSTASSEKQRSF